MCFSSVLQQRKRHLLALKKRRCLKRKEQAAEYAKLLAIRIKEKKKAKDEERKRRRSSSLRLSTASSEASATPKKAAAPAPAPKTAPAPAAPAKGAKATPAAKGAKAAPAASAKGGMFVYIKIYSSRQSSSSLFCLFQNLGSTFLSGFFFLAQPIR